MRKKEERRREGRSEGGKGEGKELSLMSQRR